MFVLADVSRPLAIAPDQGAAAAPVLFLSEGDCLVAHGVRAAVTAPQQRVAAAAASLLSDRAHVVVGALPFNSTGEARLIAPQHVERLPLWNLRPAAAAVRRQVRSVRIAPGDDGYRANVAAALHKIRTAGLRKVVLSRRLTLDFDVPIDPLDVVTRLQRDPRVTTFCLPIDAPDAPGWLVGATPELLIAKRGSGIHSAPLAGSARRHADAARDREAAERLAASEKDRREHATVVEWIADRLTPFCRTLVVPASPQITSTATMWHLGTSIHGELEDPDTPSIELAALLHPTPAVCGVPHDAARAAIATLEPFERRYYGGAVGWTAADGDGRWLVTIRCAELHGTTAQLFAGAGIVSGSEPQTELDETAAKFSTLLDALGVDAAMVAGERPS